MCAIAARSGTSEPVFVDDPEPGPPGDGEVLCRTLQLGVCGTDREILESTAPWVPKDLDYLILGRTTEDELNAVIERLSRATMGEV